MADTLYVCTGLNRLTGVREQCSMIAPKEVAEQFLDTWKSCRHRNKAFTHLRLEPYNPALPFNAKQKKNAFHSKLQHL